MKNPTFLKFLILNLLVFNSYPGFFKEMDAWNARNNKDFLNAIRYMLHPILPGYIASASLQAPLSDDSQEEATNLHFNHEKEIRARFASHFIGKCPTDLTILRAYFGNPASFDDLNKPHGLLLYGPPGTGKTTIARILAGESNLDFISLSGSDFSQKYYGDGSKAVHALFRYARNLKKPVILFIDEIDSVGVKRTDDSNQEDRKVLNTLLEELTNEQNKDVFIVGATNHIDLLDSAFRRRFNYQAKIDVPDDNQRKQIFLFYLADKKHFLDCPTCKTIDCKCADSPLKNLLEKMKKNGCSGQNKPFSGSDIKELVDRAAILARITKQEKMYAPHFNEAYASIAERSQVDWTVLGWDGALYRGLWRAPVVGDAATWIHNLRKPDKE